MTGRIRIRMRVPPHGPEYFEYMGPTGILLRAYTLTSLLVTVKAVYAQVGPTRFTWGSHTGSKHGPLMNRIVLDPKVALADRRLVVGPDV